MESLKKKGSIIPKEIRKKGKKTNRTNKKKYQDDRFKSNHISNHIKCKWSKYPN